MDFVSAVKTIKAQRGVTNTFYAMLCDYGAFDEEERWVKGIVKQICESGFAIRLSGLSASNGQLETEVSDMMYRLTSQFGYREDAVSDIFHKLCLGMGLVGTSYDWVRAFHVGSPQSVSRSSVSSSSFDSSLRNIKSKGNGSANGHDYVDLGLPSGTLWATCNVGASKPEDYGNYYAWGETGAKSSYSDKTYKYDNGHYDKLTKYCNSSEYGNNGLIDNLTVLQPEDDAATANWGNDWRMPTKEEWEELEENTAIECAKLNGVLGRLFTSKNGQTLFLPFAGYLNDNNLQFAGWFGHYWSNMLDSAEVPLYAWMFDISQIGYGEDSKNRYLGCSVRPVRSN